MSASMSWSAFGPLGRAIPGTSSTLSAQLQITQVDVLDSNVNQMKMSQLTFDCGRHRSPALTSYANHPHIFDMKSDEKDA